MNKLKNHDIDIQVALTTTGFFVDSIGMEEKDQDTFKNYDIPVLVAKAGIHVISNKQELAEFRLAQTAQKMANEVKIDVENKHILIGESPFKEQQSILVDYVDTKNSEYVDKFFERWVKTKILFFEYQIKNMLNENVCCVIGMWDTDKWNNIKIGYSPKFNILWQD